MKTNKLLLFLTIVYSLTSFSQNVEKPNYWIVKYNPTHLIDFITFPTITIAAEKKITSRLSINAEVGNQFSDFRNQDVDTIFNASKGFKTNIEGRLYWKSNNGFYNGVQLFYRHNQFTRTISYTKNNANENDLGYSDNFGVKKTAAGVILLIGYQYITSYHVVFESYFGVGFTNRKIKNNHRQFDKSKDIEQDGVDQLFNLASSDLSEASGNSVVLTIGIRLGYQF